MSRPCVWLPTIFQGSVLQSINGRFAEQGQDCIAHLWSCCCRMSLTRMPFATAGVISFCTESAQRHASSKNLIVLVLVRSRSASAWWLPTCKKLSHDCVSTHLLADCFHSWSGNLWPYTAILLNMRSDMMLLCH